MQINAQAVPAGNPAAGLTHINIPCPEEGAHCRTPFWFW
jgi:hypothetical protein